MGLLLSILVFTVGVMEAIACIRHIQYGYLPEWAPRRHVLATGTSGLTNLRDRWRKKPSKSADCDNKTKKRGYDVSRSCDIPCSETVCQQPLGCSGQNNQLTSTFHSIEDTCLNDPVSSDVGEFNLHYQEFAEILPQEANAVSKRRISSDDICFRNPEEVPSQIVVNCDYETVQTSSCCDITVEECLLSSRSQSSSPIRSKTDINWPVFTPHIHISRRPSTPTTAEEEGGNSPYFGGEFLTEEHVKSTQRPLAVLTKTYHSDQDIIPVLLQDNAAVDEIRSVNRPLTVASHTDELGSMDYKNCVKQVYSTPEKQEEIIRPSSNSHKSSKDVCLSNSDPQMQPNSTSILQECPNHSTSFPLSGDDMSAHNGVMSRPEEDKALQICIKQKRRSSKTEYLPHNEEILATISQKELTPEPTYASQKEEPIRLKPVKTTAFEEARLENFKKEPLHAEVSITSHEGARRSSILSAPEISDASSIIEVEVSHNDVFSKTNVDETIHSETGLKKKKGVKFDETPDVSVVETPVLNVTLSEDMNSICNIEPRIEMTAISLVDKIVDEAVAKINNARTLSNNGLKEFVEKFCLTEESNENNAVTKDLSNKIKEECSSLEERVMSEQKKDIVNHNFDSTVLASSEKDQNISCVDFVATKTAAEKNIHKDISNVEESSSSVVDDILPPKPTPTKESTEDSYSKNDSNKTKFLGENTLEKTKVLNEGFKEPQKAVQSDDSLSPANQETKGSAIQEKNEVPFQSEVCAENIEKGELSITEDSSDNLDPESTSSAETKEQSSSSNSFPQSKTTEGTKSDEIKKEQQRSSDGTPEAFWLIFSGEYTKAMSKDWHSGHFCCWQCDESLTGQRYVLRDDHPYCIKCYESVFANTCEECNRTIGIDSKDLSYKDKHWHEACFLCTKCRVSLVDKQFGSKADKIYCGNCYDAQFASRCDGCGEIFRAGTKKMEYKTRQWHEKCFCCCVCKTAIGTKSFIPREQEIYCANCYEEKFATRCVKCNKIITSGGVTYKNEPWHRECFTCTNCNTSLAGQRFTSRDEKPYCADCFGELFAKRCTSCSRPITGIGGTRFISFEDRHWHNDCFICASCKTSLVGRGFITDADDIICPDCAKQKLM